MMRNISKLPIIGAALISRGFSAISIVIDGALSTGTQVQVEENSGSPWVPIIEPMDGYVAARFLGQCI